MLIGTLEPAGWFGRSQAIEVSRRWTRPVRALSDSGDVGSKLHGGFRRDSFRGFLKTRSGASSHSEATALSGVRGKKGGTSKVRWRASISPLLDAGAGDLTFRRWSLIVRRGPIPVVGGPPARRRPLAWHVKNRSAAEVRGISAGELGFQSCWKAGGCVEESRERQALRRRDEGGRPRQS